jgi:trimethylamine--corrinoid protein Co-methyltransferase
LLHNVEFLSGLVLFQLVNPGTPIIYGTGASQLDMQTGRYGGSADGHAMRLALCDLARFYHLPTNVWGLSTASSELDAEYGYEATTHGLLAQLRGADEIYSIGLLGSAQILSLDKMVLDNHIARQLRLVTRPLLVDDDHLQVDLIERVGIGGHYLGQRETRTHTRREYVPVWPAADVRLLDMIHQEALDISRNHQPPPLPAGAEEKVKSILASADEELV